MVLILSRSNVRDIISISDVIASVERAHSLHAKGLAVQPNRATVNVTGTSNAILPMPATIRDMQAAGMKLLSIFPSNRETGLPALSAVVVLVDIKSGRCEAVLDGGLLTAFRTAAASAIATKYMARTDARVLGLVGAGLEARTHLNAISTIRPIDTVLVWSRSKATAEKFVSDSRRSGILFEILDTPKDVVLKSDILCTLTPSKTPIVLGSWFAPGLHINAVGTHWIDFREIDSEAVARSRVVCDSRTANELECGDLMIPVAEGLITREHFHDELGQVINQEVDGRRSHEEITMYQSVGVAIQDIATAQMLVKVARDKGIGLEVEL